MTRYLNGVISGLEANGISYQVVQPKTNGVKAKYVDYPLLTWRERKRGGTHLVISERYAYLIPFMGKKSVVVCHDLHTLYDQAKTPRIHRIVYRFFLACMKKANKVVCVSEHTRSDLKKFVPGFNDHHNLQVVHNGVEGFWIDGKSERIENPGLNELFEQKKILLSVGTDAWYKNNQWSLRFLSKLSDEHHLLRIGDFNSSNVQLIEELNLESRITRIQSISDATLKYCYENARALLFPSLTEGYGWPALEAALCGCRVVSDGNGAIKEIFANGQGLVNQEKASRSLEELGSQKHNLYYRLWDAQVLELLA